MQTTQPALTIWVAAVTAAAAVLLLLVDHDQPSYWSGFWPALNWSRREKERKKERKKGKRREEKRRGTSLFKGAAARADLQAAAPSSFAEIRMKVGCCCRLSS
jgi:hypothetical protein